MGVRVRSDSICKQEFFGTEPCLLDKPRADEPPSAVKLIKMLLYLRCRFVVVVYGFESVPLVYGSVPAEHEPVSALAMLVREIGIYSQCH